MIARLCESFGGRNVRASAFAFIREEWLPTKAFCAMADRSLERHAGNTRPCAIYQAKTRADKCHRDELRPERCRRTESETPPEGRIVQFT